MKFQHVTSTGGFDYSIQKQFNDSIYGEPCAHDYRYYDELLDVGIPELDLDGIAHDLSIGLENWSTVAGKALIQIVKTTASANKPAQLYQLYLRAVHGVRDQRAIIKHWKSLTTEQQIALGHVLNDHLVDVYNYLIDDLNWVAENS